MSAVNILYASDDNYAPIAGVSMTSLFENNQGIEELRVWYIVDQVSQDNIDRLSRTADSYHRTITFLDAGQNLEIIKKLGACAWFGGSYSAYSRLFLQDFIGNQELDRILYLDCDTIIDQSIEEMWNYDLENKTVGMVCDYIGAGIRDVIGLKRTDKYYNSGVLLIDLKQWKARKCQDRILWHMENVNAKYPFIDQDILNIVLKNEIKTLPWNWNVFPYYYTYSFRNIQKQYDLNAVNQYSLEEYRNGLTKDGKPDAMILHFTATYYSKPWYSNSHDPNKKVWNKYYAISEWQDSYEIRPVKLGKIPFYSRIIVKIMPQKIYLYIFRYFSRRNMKALRQSCDK